MKVKALKKYRCGETASGSAPPKKINDLMVKHLGPHGRLFVGGEYPNLHPELVKALKDDKAVEEIV